MMDTQKEEKIKASNPASVFYETNYFNKKMYESFLAGELPEAFRPYFEWKFESHDMQEISEETAYQMRDLAVELLEGYYDSYPEAFTNVELYHYDPEHYDVEESLWCSYKGFKEDKYTVSFLEKIDGELSDAIIGGLFC